MMGGLVEHNMNIVAISSPPKFKNTESSKTMVVCKSFKDNGRHYLFSIANLTNLKFIIRFSRFML